jgi:hypothetical protein
VDGKVVGADVFTWSWLVVVVATMYAPIDVVGSAAVGSKLNTPKWPRKKKRLRCTNQVGRVDVRTEVDVVGSAVVGSEQNTPKWP